MTGNSNTVIKIDAEPSGTMSDRMLLKLLLPSVLCLILCAVALSTCTWAWFSTGIASGSSTISAGNFSVSVSVNDSISEVLPANGAYSCYGSPGSETAYTVTVTPIGNTRGYCAITVNGSTYITPQLVSGGDAFTFTLVVSTDCTLRVLACWGEASETGVLAPSTQVNVSGDGE